MNRYQSIEKLKTPEGKNYYKMVKYPNIPLSEDDLYVLCNATDRYDKLALSYYQDSSLWWVISSANNAINQSSLFPPTGSYIRIPATPIESLNEFNKLNEQ